MKITEIMPPRERWMIEGSAPGTIYLRSGQRIRADLNRAIFTDSLDSALKLPFDIEFEGATVVVMHSAVEAVVLDQPEEGEE